MFFHTPIPRGQQYLLNYFKTELEQQFIRYWLWAGDMSLFTQHTGYYCEPRWIRILLSRMECILALHKRTKAELSDAALALLAKIERGKLSLGQINKLLSEEKRNEEDFTRGGIPGPHDSNVVNDADIDP